MTEQESGTDLQPEPLFDPDLIGTHLLVGAEPRLHSVFGEGYHFPLGDKAPENPIAELEFYPDSKMIRYTSGSIDLTMKGETFGEYTEQGLAFTAVDDSGRQDLHVARSGDIFLFSHHSAPSVHIEEARVEEGPSAPDTEKAVTEDKEKQPKVTVEGRAGRDASLRETKNGKKIAKFPLAQHEAGEDGKDATTWHTIVAFNSLAETVGETVKKGQQYKVVGFLHERVEEDKTIREIYAVNVKARAPQRSEERSADQPATEQTTS